MFKNLCKIVASIALMYSVSSVAMIPITRAQRIAFLMSGHERLGANSPAGMIDVYMLREILSYIPETRNVVVANRDAAKLVVNITDDQNVVREYFPLTGLNTRCVLGAARGSINPRRRNVSSDNLSVVLPLSYIRAEVMDSEGLQPLYSFTLTPQQIASMATLQITQHCAKCIGFDGDSCVVGSRR